ncbi:MAG: hypothetical protein JWP75_3684 [Frondihabitans sp.]|nr:hypothetical protein [Frondihabitans sp.]
MLQKEMRYAPPSFERLVPGRLVHRRNLNDVLVTDSQPAGGDLFRCGVHWPLNHILFGRGSGIDAALVAETVRQVTTHVVHTHYGVPLDTQFLMSRLQITIDAAANERAVASDLVVTLAMNDVRRNKTTLTSFVSRIDIHDRHGFVASGAGFARLVNAEAYRRSRTVAEPSRATARPPAVSKVRARQVGVVDDHLVLIAPTPSSMTFRLDPDPSVSAYFDHELDHVPGMAILESGRQAIRYVTRRPDADFLEADLRFAQLIELDTPSYIDVRADGDESYSLTFSQDNNVRSSGSVRIRTRRSPLD